MSSEPITGQIDGGDEDCPLNFLNYVTKPDLVLFNKVNSTCFERRIAIGACRHHCQNSQRYIRG